VVVETRLSVRTDDLFAGHGLRSRSCHRCENFLKYSA
jgi:hypothetical protein